MYVCVLHVCAYIYIYIHMCMQLCMNINFYIIFYKIRNCKQKSFDIIGQWRWHSGIALASSSQGRGFESSHRCWHQEEESGKKGLVLFAFKYSPKCSVKGRPIGKVSVGQLLHGTIVASPYHVEKQEPTVSASSFNTYSFPYFAPTDSNHRHLFLMEIIFRSQICYFKRPFTKDNI